MKRFTKPGPATSALLQRLPQLLAQLVRDPAGDVTRGLAQHRREQHRRVGGVVAHLRAGRALQRGRLGRSEPRTRTAAASTAAESSEIGSGTTPINSDTARRRGSCARAAAARAGPRARADGAASWGRRTAAGPPARGRAPAGPPITKHSSRPSIRRSSRNRENATESIVRPPVSSRHTYARSGTRLTACSPSRTSITSTRAQPRQEALIVLHIVHVGRAQATDGEHDNSHRVNPRY